MAASPLFPNRTPHEVQRRWAFIKHQDGHSSVEVQQTISKTSEELSRENEQPELEIARFEEVTASDDGGDSFCDWDE
jgi:hypothetical protein